MISKGGATGFGRVIAGRYFSVTVMAGWIVPVLAICALWLAIQHHVGALRDRSIAGAEKELANLALAFDEDLSRSLAGLDLVVRTLRRAYLTEGASPRVNAMAESFVAEYPLVASVGVADAAGDLVLVAAPAQPPGTERVNIADRPHFQAHIAPGEDRLYVGPPLVSRVGGQWSVFISRRVVHDDGTFGGVVIATLDAAKLARFYEKIDVGPQGVVTVVGLDGIVRVRISQGEGIRYGDSLAGVGPLVAVRKAPVGVYRAEARIDGIARIFAYRVIAAAPLIVVVGRTEGTVLAEMQRTRAGYHMGGAVVTGVILLATLLLTIHWQAITARNAVLEAVFRAMPDGAVVLGADFRPLQANERFAELLAESRAGGPDDSAGLSLLDLIRPDRRASPTGGTVSVAGAQAPFHHHAQLPSGRWVETRVSAIEGGGWFALLRDITESRRHEADLERHDTLMRTIFSSMSDGISVFDEELRLVAWNDRCFDIAGLDPSFGRPGVPAREILLAQIRSGEFGPCDDPEAAVEERLATLWQPRATTVERRRPDGRTIEVRRNPLPGGGFVTIYIDISARKDGERALVALNATLEQRIAERTAALAASEQRLAHAQKIARVGHWVRDDAVGADCIELSLEAASIAGMAVAGAIQVPDFLDSFVHPEDRARIGAAFAGYAALAGLETPVEYRIRRTDGTVRFVLQVAERVQAASGDAYEIIGIMLDITERKAADSALSAARDHLLDAVDSIINGIALYDRDDRIVLVNDRFVAHYPGAAGIVRVGTRFEDTFRALVDALDVPPGTDREALVAERLVAHRRADGQPIVKRFRDGRIIEVTERRARSGGIVAVSLDITAQTERERELRHAQKLEAVGQLTGGVAHDFNNLLGAIVGNLELIAEATDVAPATRQLVRNALEAAGRGASLTQQLLAFSRKQTLQPTAIDVGELIARCAGLYRRTLGETIEVAVSAPAGLWACRADQGLLESALLNLAINARDAMPEGGRLAIGADNAVLDAAYAARHPGVVPGEYVQLSLADSGTGMPPEVLARAFEPFFTTKEIGKGSGLGLSMVLGFAQQSGGHVRIDSRAGGGTAIHLYLPRAAATAAPAAGTAGTAVAHGAGRKVLVVEDNAMMRQTSVAMLRKLGYAPVAVGNAAAALAALASDPGIAVLFTDVVMPGGMSGFELAEVALQRRPGLHVIFTSGFPDAGRSPGAGDDAAILPKPFRIADLARKLGELREAA